MNTPSPSRVAVSMYRAATPHPAQPSARHAFVGLLMTLALGGCTMGPDFVAPDKPAEQVYVPHAAAGTGPTGPGEMVQQVSMSAPVQRDWWTLLRSPELDRTVEMALANNWSIKVAGENLARVSEGIAVARGGLFPQIDGAASGGRKEYGASFLGPEAFTFPMYSAYSGGISVSYDLDVFGGQKRRVELAAADAQVQGEVVNAAHLSVVGDTVFEALQIASIRAQINVAGDVIASDQQNLSLVQAARDAGVVSQMDVTTAQSQLDSDRALLPPLHQQLNVAQDALAVLVGKSPANWTPPDFDLEHLALPQDVSLTVPSELVRARPDIRAAEAQLHAASAQVGIATADMYPHITLSGGYAQEGLFSGPSGAAWSLIGGIAGPIFHGGALSARRRAAQDAYQASFAQYQQTVLVSFQQVADSLHGLSNAADEVRAQQQALDSANAALGLTRRGYGVGNAGIVQVLDAQRLQQLAQLRLVQARTRRYVQTVSLFLAAGGGIADAAPPGA